MKETKEKIVTADGGKFNRKIFSALKYVSRVCTAVAVASLIAVIAYVLVNGVGEISADLLFGEYKGDNVSILPALKGTIDLVLVAAAIAVPIGIFTAIFLVEYMRGKGKPSLRTGGLSRGGTCARREQSAHDFHGGASGGGERYRDGGDPCDRARDQRKRCADFNDRHGGEQNARVDDVPGNEPCAGYLLFREQRLSEAGGCHGGGAFIACGRAESSCDGRGKTFEEKNGREVTLWKTKRYNKKKLRKRKIFP